MPERKFTADQVRAIRDEAVHGASCDQLAQRYGVNHRTMWQILHRVSYADVPDLAPPESFVHLWVADTIQSVSFRLTFARWLWELLCEPLHIQISRPDRETIILRAGGDDDPLIHAGLAANCFIPVADLDVLGWRAGEYTGYFQITQLAIRVPAIAPPDWQPPQPPMNSSELTLPQAAKILGIVRQRVHQLIQSGQLPARYTNGRWVIPRDAVDARKNKRGAAGEN